MIQQETTELFYALSKELNHPVKRGIINEFLKIGGVLPVSMFKKGSYGDSMYINRIFCDLRKAGILKHQARTRRDSTHYINTDLMRIIIKIIRTIEEIK